MTGFHTEKEIYEFVAEKHNQQIDLFNDLPFYAYFFEDYSETESVIYFAADHSLICGVRLMAAQGYIFDNQALIRPLRAVKVPPLWMRMVG